MKRFLALATLLAVSATGCMASQEKSSGATRLGEPFAFRVLTTGLADPWEITWGPDGFLWVTEKTGKRVTRVNPSDGSKTTVITIADVYSTESQDGLLGMAFAPNFLKGSNDVYLAYTYDADPGPAVDRRAKIARYTYDPAAHKLSHPVDVITGLPASTDHNAGRLLVGPDQKLYYSIGDQGNNQFERFCNPIRAQDLPTADDVSARNWATYVGKVLRLNLDGGVPSDNPVIRGVRSHIYSYGHRNPQGLVFGPGGRLFSAEHGPKADDEINLIQAGKNYGWPYVSGFKDDQSYVYANWSASTTPPCASLHYNSFKIPPSVPQQKETAWSSPDYVDPLKTLYTVPNGYNFQDPACGKQSYICWPSIAPSSIDYVPADQGVFAGWRNSLLVTSLKNGALYCLRLTQDGGSVQGDITQFFKTTNRYRDLALSPDHRTVYIATDSAGRAGPQFGPPTEKLDNPGAILEFTFVGSR
ncbi:MAG TPA: glucose/sorbosone family PQQ-dependent dehydrogenase [Pseudonocardiaceae bacterium]|jgi:PQQ-dependent dehydrogenase (s-GDH family)|nr:glucose/sorbosone family PQQ-dependent dehydrogenase [Pseudonocardiaceae bacterium]